MNIFRIAMSTRKARSELVLAWLLTGSIGLAYTALAYTALTYMGLTGSGASCWADEPPSISRTAWTQSRLHGSPEPPLPYVLTRAFPLEFTAPISLNRMPSTDILLVCEQHGSIYAFDGAQGEPHKSLCVDFNQTPPPSVNLVANQQIQLFSLTYHPNFASNRWVYVCFVTQGGEAEPQTHISRFELPATAPLQLSLASEVAVLTCAGGGHNGSTLAFGPDGYLYISIGDLEVPNPPDPRNTGQDISDLYADILRIDVDRHSGQQNYAIPADNPFVDIPHARPEVYAYGLRNPFRMSFDAPTGDLWVGDVGWEAWEMVYRVQAGGNYGWAIKEGPGDVKPQTPGPTPILPPDIALNHSQAASVTGGLVYRGTKYLDLNGSYIFGDWITRKFWAARFDSERVLDYREIATGSVKPICFETDSHGELLIMDYSDWNQASGIYRLVPNPLPTGASEEFPRLISETGLFADTAAYVAADGVVPYRINAPMWADGAQADYLLAIPGEKQAVFHDTPQKMFDWFNTTVQLPRGSVLAKTYSMPTETSTERIETQIALKDEQGDWQYYSYRWNAAGSDASLVGATGEVATIGDLDWQFGARTSCRICHTPWTGETVGFIEPQLRSAHGGVDNWQALLASGAVRVERTGDLPVDANSTRLVDPSDGTAPLDRRVRAYLHTNCAHCHMNGGNASTTIDVSFQKLLADTGMVERPPMRGDLGLGGARIVSPGSPAQSILFARLAKSGAGHMPHIGSSQTDPLGVQIVRQWIAQLPRSLELRTSLDELCAPQSAVDDNRRRAAAQTLLASYEGAVELAGALAEGRVPERLVHEIVATARDASLAISDLIEPYAAADQRLPRLGAGFQPTQVLAVQGDAQQGRELFTRGLGTCSSCHRLETIGKELGPDLSQLPSERSTPEMLLKSIMHPSADIEDKYRVVQVLTDAGQVSVGRVVSRDPQQLVLQDAAGQLVTIDISSVEQEQAMAVSLMPEQLLAALTAQQAADLLAYLWEVSRRP